MRNKRYLRFGLLICAGFCSIVPLYAEPPGNEQPMGPLTGRNMYAAHIPWFSFPGEKAGALPLNTVVLRTALYYINEFEPYTFDPDLYVLDSEGRLPVAGQNDRTAVDYESLIWEAGITWQAMPAWRFSLDWRFHTRFGGFLDGFIEGWHSFLGLPNASREYFDRNRAYWNITTDSGPAYFGEGATAASGDIDFRTTWSFWSGKRSNLAASGAFKLPVGRQQVGFGSGLPDVAFALLADWEAGLRWYFYFNTGVILPLGDGRAMGQFAPAVEFRAFRRLSFITQLNIQSSPVVGAEGYYHHLFGSVKTFSLPQTNLKMGLKARSGPWIWQFYFEQNTLTWAGADTLFFLGTEYHFVL